MDRIYRILANRLIDDARDADLDGLGLSPKPTRRGHARWLTRRPPGKNEPESAVTASGFYQWARQDSNL